MRVTRLVSFGRCIYHAAVWYHDHLAGLRPVVMITEDQEAVAEFGSSASGIYVISTQVPDGQTKSIHNMAVLLVLDPYHSSIINIPSI